MHNRFDSLLRRCKARRRKMLVKRIGIFAAFVLLASAAAYISGSGVSLFDTERKQAEPIAFEESGQNLRTERLSANLDPRSEVSGKKVENGETPKPNPEPKPEPESKPTVLTEKVPPKKEEPLKRSGDRVASVETKKVSEPKKERPKEQTAKQSEVKSDEKERPKVVLEVKEVTDLDALLERYRNSPRFSTALKIAMAYYDDGDFSNASLWARRANLLDRDDERAWIIYAESEYALGREERAKRILRLFLDYKDSAKARSLLITWSRQ